eukprot:gnl/MRDRNA2_/MRDRNA2_91006_c0_seq1.p1 gnl/MRDRNA2_/MRDRNA2_91006_c0~~gnl/MRDRNA2_/MRDRNA2_91006_c0_seq1.p1  ORF type:complete len:204 (-),score=47.11 gnl/MRDRNA2_/MRDRNA2_91006_c0_seq1:215-826(-)
MAAALPAGVPEAGNFTQQDGELSVRSSSSDSDEEGALKVDAADYSIAFEMLDKDRDGMLSRRDGRAWLRCVGWCLSDEALDTLLDSVPPRGAGAGGTRGWTLDRLCQVAEQHEASRGPDVEGLRRALRILAGRTSKMNKETFREYTSLDNIFSEADFTELMDLCGVASTAKFVDVDTLANAMAEKIINPPAIQARLTSHGPRR